jgi:hypothetical protein
MTVASNIGDSFNRLNDHQAALEWMQRTLDLARPNGWPGMLGLTLMRTADTLRGLRRLDASAEMLREALALLAPLSASHIYAIALNYLGDVELGSQHYASAIGTFASWSSAPSRWYNRPALRGPARSARRWSNWASLSLLQAAQAALAAAASDAHRQIAAAGAGRHPCPPCRHATIESSIRGRDLTLAAARWISRAPRFRALASSFLLGGAIRDPHEGSSIIASPRPTWSGGPGLFLMLKEEFTFATRTSQVTKPAIGSRTGSRHRSDSGLSPGRRRIHVGRTARRRIRGWTCLSVSRTPRPSRARLSPSRRADLAF